MLKGINMDIEISKWLPFYEQLSDEEKKLIQNNIQKVEYKKNEKIHNGENCLGLIAVTSGQLRAYIISKNAKELTLYRLIDGEVCLFSAKCILNEIDFDININAEKDTSCLLLPVKIVKQLNSESKVVSEFLNNLMSQRFTDVMWLIEQTLFKSFDERLAAFLIEQSSIENSMLLNITHEEIANHLGSAREVVSRMLKHFENENIISLSRGEIKITDSKKLFSLAKID